LHHVIILNLRNYLGGWIDLKLLYW